MSAPLDSHIDTRSAARAADALREWVNEMRPEHSEDIKRSLKLPERPPSYGDVDMYGYASEILTTLDAIVDSALREALRTRGIRPSVRHLNTTR